MKNNDANRSTQNAFLYLAEYHFCTLRGAWSEMAKDQRGTISPPVTLAGKSISHRSVAGDPKHVVRLSNVLEHHPGETDSSGSRGSCSSWSLRLMR
jgi:hypothetical protein